MTNIDAHEAHLAKHKTLTHAIAYVLSVPEYCVRGNINPYDGPGEPCALLEEYNAVVTTTPIFAFYTKKRLLVFESKYTKQIFDNCKPIKGPYRVEQNIGIETDFYMFSFYDIAQTIPTLQKDCDQFMSWETIEELAKKYEPKPNG